MPTNTTQSGPSATTLHDFHGATRLVYMESPLLQRLPELVPADDFDLLVATFHELEPVRALDSAGSQAFLLRLLDGALDAHRLHDHPIPPGSRDGSAVADV